MLNKQKQHISGEPLYIPRGWDEALWRQVWSIAERMSRQELAAFWITSLAVLPEERFNKVLEQARNFSKDDLLGFIDEIEPDDAHRLIAQYPYYLLKRYPESEVNHHGMARKQTARKQRYPRGQRAR